MAATPLLISLNSSTPTLLFQVVDGITYAGLTSPAANVLKAGDVNAPLPLLLVFPASPVIYLGGSTVTAVTGVAMPASFTFSYNVVGDDSLYAISASATPVVSILVLRQ